MLVINVKKDIISISKDENLNKGEYNVTKCKFKFSKEYDNASLVKKAVFSTLDKDYIKIIANDECDIPGEIFKYKGSIRIGVFATYTDSEGNNVIRYSPAPISKAVLDGSFIESGANSEKITASEMEQYMQILQNGLSSVDNRLSEVERLASEVEEIGKTTFNVATEAEAKGNYAEKQGDYAKAQADNAKNVTDDLIEKEKNGELNGATFTPNVDFSGNLSWTNDKNLDNPETVNITGPQGSKGDCNFATFDIDIETGNLVMTKPDDMSQIDFGLNEKTGNLEVIVNV